MSNCWFIVSVDIDGGVRIVKRSPDADQYFDDPENSVEYAVCEATGDKPAGIYKMSLDIDLLYELPDFKKEE